MILNDTFEEDLKKIEEEKNKKIIEKDDEENIKIIYNSIMLQDKLLNEVNDISLKDKNLIPELLEKLS